MGGMDVKFGNGLRKSLMATTVMAAMLPMAAWAAEEAPPSDTTVDEVIVSPRKRDERLQDVPLSMTAVNGQALERENIVETADLIRKSPSLTMSPGLGSSKATPNFSIRGLSQQEQTPLADGSVTVYVGDIVAARAQGLNQSLFDVASVEVLKGPQGTLFGRNATGGAILIKPNKPIDAFEAYVTGGIGNYNLRQLEGMVNVPLGDRAQLRLAATMQQRDGFIIDDVTDTDINYTDTWAFRASFAWQPTDAIESLTVFNMFNEDDGGQGSFISTINPNGVFNSAPARTPRNYPTLQSMLAAQEGRNKYHTASGTPMYTQVETWDLANTTTFDINENISIRNIIGVRSVKLDMMEDTDGLPIPLLEIERHFEDDQFSEEFQVFGDTGPINWIVGAYYFQEEADDQGLSVTGGVDPGAIHPRSVTGYAAWSNTWSKVENTSYAVFAQGTWKIVDGLSFTAGVRQNWDKREAVIMNRTQSACRFTTNADGNPATPETATPLANCALPLSAKFDEPTYGLSLDWKIDDDTLIYAAHRHGYRTGGFAARASTEAGLRRTFEPETVDDFEIGIKRDWRVGDSFLRTNLAVFTADYQNIQRLLTDPTTIPVTTVAVNAASAKITGAEFEFLVRPNQWFEISGFYSYTDAAFEEFITPGGVDLSNNPFARAPDNIFSISARVNFPTPDTMGDLSAGVSYYSHDDWWINDDTNSVASGFRETGHLPAYKLVNLDVQWKQVAGTALDMSFFVNNATDEYIEVPELSIVTSLGFDARSAMPPRTYGLRLTYRFGS
jgi:iron complex outermembrane receptor protein